jgi:hypothetical protein
MPLDAIAPRSRRAVLAGAVGGLAGMLASRLGSPEPVSASAGSPLIIGSETNDAGIASTQLIANSPVVAFKLYQKAPASTGLMGYSTSSVGSTRGVYGRADSPNGDGVQARNGGAAGAGAAVRAIGAHNNAIVATTDSAAAVAGLFENTDVSGVSLDNPSTAVRGLTGGATVASLHRGGIGPAAGEFAGYAGVIGSSTSDVGTGVIGIGGGFDGGQGVLGLSSNIGVAGRADFGTGVQGASITQTGVRGTSIESTGVEGVSGAGRGVAGFSSTYVGVYGWSGGSYAGYFDGDLATTGTLSKAAGSFVIDHPLDPTRKTLSHSFVESPDMMNIYNGIATTDAKGRARITLPVWFGALNRDFRYQLTTIGGWSEAWISAEIIDNKFTIATREAATRVSWQVTGVRKDAYAEAHRIPVVSTKPRAEQGTYLHPKEHGKPDSAGRDFKDRPAVRP